MKIDILKLTFLHENTMALEKNVYDMKRYSNVCIYYRI